MSWPNQALQQTAAAMLVSLVFLSVRGRRC
jgi:hypothetical protein